MDNSRIGFSIVKRKELDSLKPARGRDKRLFNDVMKRATWDDSYVGSTMAKYNQVVKTRVGRSLKVGLGLGALSAASGLLAYCGVAVATVSPLGFGLAAAGLGTLAVGAGMNALRNRNWGREARNLVAGVASQALEQKEARGEFTYRPDYLTDLSKLEISLSDGHETDDWKTMDLCDAAATPPRPGGDPEPPEQEGGLKGAAKQFWRKVTGQRQPEPEPPPRKRTTSSGPRPGSGYRPGSGFNPGFGGNPGGPFVFGDVFEEMFGSDFTRAAGGAYAGAGQQHQRPAGQPPEKNHYATFGLPLGASLDEVKKRYKEIMREDHPDTFESTHPNATKVEIEAAKARVRAATESYTELKTPDKKAAYDARMGFA